MANYTPEQIEVFCTHNEACDTWDLIKWIVELLPQDEFNNYVDSALLDLHECEECKPDCKFCKIDEIIRKGENK